jgi:hypothetical protein
MTTELCPACNGTGLTVVPVKTPIFIDAIELVNDVATVVQKQNGFSMRFNRPPCKCTQVHAR